MSKPNEAHDKEVGVPPLDEPEATKPNEALVREVDVQHEGIPLEEIPKNKKVP